MYLELISNNTVQQKVDLSEEQNSLSNFDESYINVVYQDTNYSMFLGDISPDSNISILNLMINNQEIDINYKYSSEKLGYLISFKNPPFNLVYGITDISIIFLINDSESIYYSPFFAVAIKQNFQETMNSIHEMLDDIYLKDHYLLLSERYRSKFNPRNKEQNKLEYEISLLKEIIILLKQNANNFINNPKTVPISVYNIDNFEKLRNVGSSNVEHIIRHPDELNKSNSHTGININRSYYIPKKTLISTINASKDTVENHAIISFINTLLNYVSTQIIELEKQISKDANNLFKNEEIQNGYIVSFIIIEQYLKISFKNYLIELKEIFTILKELSIQYKNELIDTNELLHLVPPPTSTFLEVYHYRKIYECIVRWFSFSKPDIPNRNVIMHFYTADKIYEYYCLLNIIDLLNLLGYNEEITKRSTYPYDIKNYNRYLSVYNFNTFYFTKDKKTEVTLYYQPVIFSKTNNIKRNNISLFRTDYSTYPYFTPDFIIKANIDQNVKYAIIDAKWRNRNSLKNNSGGFKDCIYKYYASVSDEKTLKPVSFMWLLQGKDDIKKTYYHQNSSISKLHGKDFVNSIGIVTLTPKSGTSEMLKILNQFLS